MAPQTTAAPRNKLVVRRLPPTLPEEIFWKSVAEWVNDETCLWRRYVKGKPGDGHYDAHYTHSRAYVLMATPQALVDFHRAFDGHVFRAKTGAEFQAVVEYAPVQKTPYKIKVKTDARQATIDDDPDFKSFLDIFNAPASKAPLEVSAPISQPSTTPLLDHLRSQGRGARSKSKAKPTTSSSASESNRRAAAIASVNAAVQKRQAQAGPVMVAGKGREVVIAQPESGATVPEPSAGGAGAAATGAQEGKKRGGRGRGKGKKEKEQGAAAPAGQTSQAGLSTSGRQTPVPARQPPASTTPAPPTPILPVQANASGRATPKPPAQNKQHSGRSTPAAPPARIDQPQAQAPAHVPPRQPPLPGRGMPPVRGGRGMAPGGRGGRGGGVGRGGQPQIQILARNAAVGAGGVGAGAAAGPGAGMGAGSRGGRGGRGGAAGGARIDM
ncbi:hypothetical protein IAT38_001312 [Cryptococcus sp. DSM 104549]